MEERELIARCLAGEDGAWRVFLSTYDEVIRHLAKLALRSCNLPGDEGHVDEIRSGVLEMLVAHDYRILRSFRWQCSFPTWLRVVVRTVCVRSVRRKKIDPRSVPPPAAPAEPLEQLLTEERLRTVRKALEGLPEREREILTMFFAEGRPYREISDALQIPMGTVATVLARAREKLRGILEGRGL
jgi:RNA polymerase sigma-70 factor (ECF subfamily)